MMIYLFDVNTKEKLAAATDMKMIQALKAALSATRPCFILTVIMGGKTA